jgi:phosphoglycolate phosphatase
MGQALQAVLFDFDGTLADSLPIGLEAFNSLADRYGFHPLSREEAESLRHLNSRQVIRRFGGTWKCSRILRAAKRKIAERATEIQPFPGIPEMLDQIHASGLNIGIVSSNSEPTIHSFLGHHNLARFVSTVRGGSSIFGKARVLRRACRALELNPSHAIYVGDETRDVEAARRAFISCIGVTWGASTRDPLGHAGAAATVDSPAELSTHILQKIT